MDKNEKLGDRESTKLEWFVGDLWDLIDEHRERFSYQEIAAMMIAIAKTLGDTYATTKWSLRTGEQMEESERA